MGRTAAASYPDHAGADGAAASSCARSSSANFGLPPPVFVLPPPSPSVLAILSFLRLLAVSVPDILVLVRILLGFSVIYLTPLFLRVHFVPIRLPLLILYWYASSPLLYILRVSFINVSAAGVITSNSAVLLSISAVDNSTPSDTILTYSSASALRLLLLLGSSALLTDSSPFFNSCLASDRFFSTSSNNPFAISSPSFG
jgi:hypothetical protein